MRREHTRHSILVVEDDQDIREAVAELLELEGYAVTSAQSLGPVLIMTASHVTQLPSGAVGLLRKPVEMAHLLQSVARHCQHP